MKVRVFEDKNELGRVAAEEGAKLIQSAISERGSANIILATGASQTEMINHLVTLADIEWAKVHAFHLDEYVDLPESHPASFRKYLKERIRDRVSGLQHIHYVNGDVPDIEEELKRLNDLISRYQIDVAFVGIGENGHLAFNDPPADFETEDPYLVVDLDRACRQQQVGEGWFKTVDDVPARAITMSIKQILKSGTLIASVPDTRKAQAVRCSVDGPVENHCPASIMQTHQDARIYLDPDSAKLLSGNRGA